MKSQGWMLTASKPFWGKYTQRGKYLAMKAPKPKSTKIEEPIERLVTVLSIWLEEPMTDLTYRKACEYVESWVEYRMPRQLIKKIR